MLALLVWSWGKRNKQMTRNKGQQLWPLLAGCEKRGVGHADTSQATS